MTLLRRGALLPSIAPCLHPFHLLPFIWRRMRSHASAGVHGSAKSRQSTKWKTRITSLISIKMSV